MHDLPANAQLRAAFEATDGIIRLAQRLAREAARRTVRSRPPRNTTLRPGPLTPMWNALVATIRHHLRRRGEKTNLGRELGVPPQRIHEYFVTRTATPDAERTLLLLDWLNTRPKPLARDPKPTRS